MKGVKNMKKQYVKPEMYFENFELSTNIATGCVESTHSFANGTCGIYVDGIGKVFMGSMDDCKYKGTDGDFSICYDVPTATNRLFNS